MAENNPLLNSPFFQQGKRLMEEGKSPIFDMNAHDVQPESDAAPKKLVPVGQPARIEPNQPQPEDTTDYSKMGMGEVLSRAAQAAPASFGKTIGQFGEAITHPAETLGALGQIGTGIVSKGAGFFGPQDEAKKAKDEAVLNAVLKHYGDVYGDIFSGATGLKKELATDPFSVGMDVAMFAPAVGAAGKLAGVQKAGKIAETALSALDPVQAATMAGKGVFNVGKGVSKEVLGRTSGVPAPVLDLINEVGKSADPKGQQIFREYMGGKGSPEAIPEVALKALDELQQGASANYVNAHQNLATDPLNTSLVDNAFREVVKDLGTNPGVLNPEGVQMLTQMHSKYRALPNTTAVALDDLRKSLSADLSDYARTTRGATMKGSFNKVLEAIKDTIAAKDQNYVKMLDDWKQWRDKLQQFQGTFGLKKNATTAGQLAKLLKSLNKKDKQNLLNQLASTEAGRYLPHMIAGTSVSSWLPDWAATIQDALLYGVGATQFGFGVPHAVGTIAAASPKLVGAGAYGLGKAEKVAGLAQPFLSSPATNVLTQVGGMMEPVEQEPYSGSRFAGGRIGRKSGGRVGNAGSAAEKLIAAAEKAKKGHSDTTSPLLDVPDEAITKALAIANEKI